MNQPPLTDPVRLLVTGTLQRPGLTRNGRFYDEKLLRWQVPEGVGDGTYVMGVDVADPEKSFTALMRGRWDASGQVEVLSYDLPKSFISAELLQELQARWLNEMMIPNKYFETPDEHA